MQERSYINTKLEVPTAMEESFLSVNENGRLVVNRAKIQQDFVFFRPVGWYLERCLIPTVCVVFASYACNIL